MIYDVLIIGAGPCGLAVASRLCESTPSALFTDAEHARYWRRPSVGSYTLGQEAKRSRGRKGSDQSNGVDGHGKQGGPSMIVLDATADSWLSLWRSRFKTLEISHLRSPLFFHCDPRDRDGLLAYSYTEGRVAELQEITNVVGKEVSKHQRKKKMKRMEKCECIQSARHLKLDNRDQIDYFTPSSGLFDDYCDSVVKRYKLNNLIQKAEVSNISYDDVGIPTEDSRLFTITTTNQQTYFARTVILATGPGKPSLPSEFQSLSSTNPNGSISHIFTTSSNPNRSSHIHLPPNIQNHLRTPQPIHIVLIGGGLTSAQTISLLLTHHQTLTIHFLVRSRLKIKPFDIDLNWVTKTRNHAMSTFYMADSADEKFHILQSARNGGSIPLAWHKILQRWVKSGRLEIREETEIDTGLSAWDDGSQTWDLVLNTPATTSPSSANSVIELKGISHLLLATQNPPSLPPFMANIKSSHPIAMTHCLPNLTSDLKWRDDLPLFVTGALAGMRLGPGAGNLAGARIGAELMGRGVEDVIKIGNGGEEGVAGGRGSERGGGRVEFGNRFEGLEGVD